MLSSAIDREVSPTHFDEPVNTVENMDMKQIYLPMESDQRPSELAVAIANKTPQKRVPLEMKFIRFNEIQGAAKLKEEMKKDPVKKDPVRKDLMTKDPMKKDPVKKLVSTKPETCIGSFAEALQKQSVSQQKFVFPTKPARSCEKPK